MHVSRLQPLCDDKQTEEKGKTYKIIHVIESVCDFQYAFELQYVPRRFTPYSKGKHPTIFVLRN